MYGETPLIAAVDIDMVTLLLKKGALIDFIDNKGESALFHASKKGHLEILEILVEAGVNIGLKNQDGRTTAMLSSNNETRMFLESLVSERNNSLKIKLIEFENLRDQLLNKEYSSDKIAQKFAKDISEITCRSSANNTRLLREHLD